MEELRPWLAPDLHAGLSRYLGRGRTGASRIFAHEQDGRDLSLTPQAVSTKYLRFLSPPAAVLQSSWLYGCSVSDGEHSIEAIFANRDDIQNALAALDPTDLVTPDTLVRLGQYHFKIEGYKSPPALSLRIDSLSLVKRRDPVIMSECEPPPVTEHKVVHQHLLAYQSTLRDDGDDNPSAHSSPAKSFKSQPEYSTVVSRFQTQMPMSPVLYESSRLGATPFAAAAATTTTDHPGTSTSPAHAHRSPKVYDVKPPSTKRRGPSGHASDHGAHPQNEDQKQRRPDPEPISQHSLSSSGPEVRAPEPPTQQRPSATTVPAAGSNKISLTAPLRSAKDAPSGVGGSGGPSEATPRSARPFARWRAEALKGRCVPRYAQQIPRDQAELFQSDCWQPPLVGRPACPGQVPLPLLEKLAAAADKAASRDHVDHVSPSTPDRVHAAKSANEDSELSSAEWSPSPTQHLRKPQRLPSESPPPDMNQAVCGVPLMSTSSPTPTAPQQPGVEVSSLPASTGAEQQHLTRRLSSATRPTQRSQHSSPAVDVPSAAAPATRPSTSQPPRFSMPNPPIHEPGPGGDEHRPRAEPTAQQVAPAAPRLLVEVERAPYPGKMTPHDQQATASSMSDRSGAHRRAQKPMVSTFVPGTYDDTDFIPAAMSEDIEATSVRQNIGTDLASPSAPVLTDLRQSRPVPIIEAVSRPENPPRFLKLARVRPHLDAICTTQEQLHDPRDPGVTSRVTYHPSGDAITSHSPPWTANSVTPGDCEHTVIAPVSQIVTAKGSVSRGPESRSLPPHPAPLLRSDSPAIALGYAEDEPTKRKRSDAPDTVRKRPRTASDPQAAATHDPDYAEIDCARREHRRQTLSAISKPALSRRLSYVSSKTDPHGTTDESDASAERQASLRQTSHGPVPISTPATRASTFSVNHPAVTRVDGRDPEGSVLAIFGQYQRAYPEYCGGVKHFVQSCRMLQKTMHDGQALHPALFDDAVFQHHHDYPRYLQQYVEDDVTDKGPASFRTFYEHTVPKPFPMRYVLHHDRLKIVAALDHGSYSHSHSNVSHSSSNMDHHAGTPMDRDVSSGSARGERGRIVRHAVAVHAPDVVPVDRAGPSDPAGVPQANSRGYQEAVASWRQQIAQVGHPELGTPHMDRRSSGAVAVRDVSPAPPTQTATPAPSQSRAAQRALSATVGNEVACNPPVRRRPRPSASPFVSSTPAPKAEARIRASSTTLADVAKRAWWKDSSTPFKAFQASVARLPGEMGLESGHTRKRLRTSDVFAWKKA